MTLDIVRIPVLNDNYVWLVHEPRAGLLVRGVRERRRLARAALHEHLEAGRDELADDLRHERHAPLARRRLSRDPDPHAGRMLVRRADPNILQRR